MSQAPILAESVPLPERTTIYPPPYASLVVGRRKRKLGEYFGLTNFGVNLTQLAPGAVSALLHRHSKQDEFIYVLQGTPTLVLGEREFVLSPGECFGCKAGAAEAHQLVNRSQQLAVIMEVGDRSTGDAVEYPHDDLKAIQLPGGVWALTHKDGRPY